MTANWYGIYILQATPDLIFKARSEFGGRTNARRLPRSADWVSAILVDSSRTPGSDPGIAARRSQDPRRSDDEGTALANAASMAMTIMSSSERRPPGSDLLSPRISYKSKTHGQQRSIRNRVSCRRADFPGTKTNSPNSR